MAEHEWRRKHRYSAYYECPRCGAVVKSCQAPSRLIGDPRVLVYMTYHLDSKASPTGVFIKTPADCDLVVVRQVTGS